MAIIIDGLLATSKLVEDLMSVFDKNEMSFRTPNRLFANYF